VTVLIEKKARAIKKPKDLKKKKISPISREWTRIKRNGKTKSWERKLGDHERRTRITPNKGEEPN